MSIRRFMTWERPAAGQTAWRIYRPYPALALAGVVFMALFSTGLFPDIPCPFRKLTGWDCPFCGVTRSLRALAAGRLEEGIGHFPLMSLMAPVGLAWLSVCLWGSAVGRVLKAGPRLRRRGVSVALAVSALTLLMANWACRLAVAP